RFRDAKLRQFATIRLITIDRKSGRLSRLDHQEAGRMSAKIRVNCFNCGKALSVPRSSIGKAGKCPGCKAIITIEAPQPRKAENRTEKPADKAEARPKQAHVVDVLDQQPTHREELGRDRTRFL